tara:strand:- start:108 stop:302 length:195 start_codon:yes stop_codon:yes gene_type:complete
MSYGQIKNLELNLYETYLEELEKKYYQGVIAWGPDKGDAYYSKLPSEMEAEAEKMVKEFMDRNS